MEEVEHFFDCPYCGKNISMLIDLNFNNQFCSTYKKKDVIELPIAHNEGNYFANKSTLKNLEDENCLYL